MSDDDTRRQIEDLSDRVARLDGATQPVPIGEQLGLGRYWQPVGGAWRFVEMSVPASGEKAWVLIIETAGGSAGLFLGRDDMERFCDQALKLRSPLQVVRDVTVLRDR